VRHFRDSPFFFSSRRRHTISTRDWSSDVCSSDLQAKRARQIGLLLALVFRIVLLSVLVWLIGLTEPIITVRDVELSWRDVILIEIGRASCRERGDDKGGERSVIG